MFTRNLFLPPKELKEFCLLFGLDVACLLAIEQTCYINGHEPVPKAGNLHLVWQYAQNPATHHHFVSMLRVMPLVFHTILTLIQDHPVFTNHSNNGQTPMKKQLAVTLYRMGRFGNGISVEDLSRIGGCGEGSVENYTSRCFMAIESLYDLFV